LDTLDNARYLAWSYVPYPPLAPFVARITNHFGVMNEENQDHHTILLCTDPRQPWLELWKRLQTFG
jgi:hypothetical protein